MSFPLDEMTEEVLRTLKAQADARGMGLAEYLRLFADAGDMPDAYGSLSAHDFNRLLDQLAEHTASLPSLPADFSRKDIYTDHD